MPNWILTVALLTILWVPAAAQTPGPSQPDSIRAVKRLFSSRRTGAQLGVGFAAATIVTPVIIGEATDTPRRAVKSDTHAAAGLVVSLPLWGIALWKWHRFSSSQEQQVLRRYEAGQPLPPYVRRRLHARFFRN